MAKSPAPETGYLAVLRTQAAVNARTVGNRQRYSEHRERLMTAILDVARAGNAGRLCLLGAGNCNDVDLPALAKRFSEIHMVDLDREALARATNAQEQPVQERLKSHAPVDLCGLLNQAEAWRRKAPTLAQVEAAVGPAVERIRAAVPGTFDVVASCCVMTQIGHGLTSVVGPEHGSLGDIHQAAAVAHLRAVAALLAPGGQAVFITDVVSSETYPLEELAPGRDLKELLTELAYAGNHFRGVNPVALSRILRRDAVLSKQAGSGRPLEPWLWRAVAARTFLVTGFVFPRQ